MQVILELLANESRLFVHIGLLSFVAISCVILGILIGSSVYRLKLLKFKDKHISHKNIESMYGSHSSINAAYDQYLLPLPTVVPKHIAVIMDGNRRFGREHHNDSLKGHYMGGEKLADFCEWCMKDNIQMATVYAFSTENWGRDPKEITALLDIFVRYAEKMKKEAVEKNMRVRVITTDDSKFSDSVKESLRSLEELTKNCTGFVINICLSYGSRGEIVDACKRIVKDYNKKEEGSIDTIDETLFSSYLLTDTLPDPDMLIRTSGEYRISNFMLWQLAYAEMFFIDKYWPQFNRYDFRSLLVQFNDRKRRFGL